MWRGRVSAVTEWCIGWNRRSRAICPPTLRRLWRIRPCPPSRCAHRQLWWARGTRLRVRLVRVCTPWRCYRRTRLTCSKSWMRVRGLRAEDIRELSKTADLSLHATKETARAIGRSMAALVVAERHLWLNLSDIKDRDRVFPSGRPAFAFRHQEAKKQAAVFQRFLPRRSLAQGAAGREQPLPRAGSSYRGVQKESVAAWRGRGGKQGSRSGASKSKPDLRKTAGSDGSCVQRDTYWPAVHATPTVVAQDQGVLPFAWSRSHSGAYVP